MATEYLSTLESLPTTLPTAKPPVTGTARVHLTQCRGPPQHLASGFIYGIPDTPSQIPTHFYSDIHFRYSRAGGSQLPNNRGWARSEAEYAERFQSTLSNYRTTRAHNGEFILLISDLWGADGGQPKDALWPGDPSKPSSSSGNGAADSSAAGEGEEDWAHYDALLRRWLTDARSAASTDPTGQSDLSGLLFDIWNEPDLHFFFDRPVTRWLALWSRTYQFLRKNIPELRITGPSLSAAPSRDNEWWMKFLEHVASTGEVPDQWSWHMESGEPKSTMTNSVSTFRKMLRARPGLEGYAETKEINVNEYATFPEQLPSGGAWWIAQLERQDVWGLRGNWAMGGALHDFMAGLVGKEGGAGRGQVGDGYVLEGKGYWATAEYWVYRYYASEMVGERVATEPTEGEGEAGDVYATFDGEGRVLRVLAGARARPGRWSVEVDGLEQKDGTVKVKTLVFKGDEKDHYKKYDAPVTGDEWEAKVTDGKIVLPVEHEEASTAFAFEISLAS